MNLVKEPYVINRKILQASQGCNNVGQRSDEAFVISTRKLKPSSSTTSSFWTGASRAALSVVSFVLPVNVLASSRYMYTCAEAPWLPLDLFRIHPLRG